MMVMAAAVHLLNGGLHLVLADRAVAIAVDLGEQRVDLGLVRIGTDRILEFGLRDLAVAVGVELAEQRLQLRRADCLDRPAPTAAPSSHRG